MRLTLILLGLMLCHPSHVLAQRMRLDDDRINERWQAARPYKLSPISFHRPTFYDPRGEIGPPGVRHTLSAMEFPWENPGGRNTRALSQTFVWPPNIKVVDKGTMTYVVPQQFDGIERRPGWTWPVDATFFELHFHPKGHAFELRVLEKVKQGRGFINYEPHIFRPFRFEEDLPFKVGSKYVKKMSVTSNHAHKPFEATGTVHVYGDVNVNWKQLVNKVWEDDLGHEWHHAGVGQGWLSPKDYQGWMIGNGESCDKCHGNAGDPVDGFDIIGRDWYGFIRGEDGIFSFDPIDRNSVTINGIRNPGGFQWKAN